jgi:hypothetical protein
MITSSGLSSSKTLSPSVFENDSARAFKIDVGLLEIDGKVERGERVFAKREGGARRDGTGIAGGGFRIAAILAEAVIRAGVEVAEGERGGGVEGAGEDEGAFRAA